LLYLTLLSLILLLVRDRYVNRNFTVWASHVFDMKMAGAAGQHQHLSFMSTRRSISSLLLTKGLYHYFLPRDAMYSADYAVAKCLSVCPSVCLLRSLICSNFFHRMVATPF